MKNIPTLFVLGALVTGLSSCEKVIDIDLKSADKKFVIEANITDQAGGCRVLLSRTKDFTDNNSFVGVPGALVIIREAGGAVTALSPTSDGIYEAPALAGVSGKTYELSVEVEGQSFTATSTMPALVNMDSIYVTSETLFDDPKLIVNIDFNDPAGQGNNYRFVQYFNHVKQDQLQFMNDDYTDGRTVTAKLFYFNDDDDEDDKDLKSGDEVKVEMYCIDAAMYKYWFSLSRSATGDSNQATPSNPVTNIKGGALGYFSAHTIQEKNMVIP